MFIQLDEWSFMISPSLREKTMAVRRAHILAAAAEVFAERGYHRATIKDVARAAGVSDGSIYNVFENKTALLLSLLDPLDAPTRSHDAVTDEAADETATLRAFIQRRWDAFGPETLQVLRSVMAEALVDEDLRRLFFERVLAPALAEPAPFSNPAASSPSDRAATLRMLVGAMMGLILLRLLGDEATARAWGAFPERLAELFAPHFPPSGDVG